MDARNTNSAFEMNGRIDLKTHNLDDLKKQTNKEWDSLSKSEKLSLTRSVNPADMETVYNVTTDRLHEYFVDNLDPGNTNPEANITAAFLALGTNGGGGTLSSDTDLNQREYEESVTDVADNGKDLLASTFIDSTEANGETYDELGLFTGDPANKADADVFLINHATFSDVTKDNTKTVTFDVTLSFSDA